MFALGVTNSPRSSVPLRYRRRMPNRDARHHSLDDAEDQLLDAMRTSDVDTLDALIADELEFTLPDGSTIGKQADLDPHRSGATRFERITEASRHTVESDGSGTTETVVDAVILWAGERIEMSLTYARLWQKVDGHWQVISGSATPHSGR